MRVCLKFLGNLAALLGGSVCIEVNECIAIKDVVGMVIRERDIPLTPEYLTFISPNGDPVSGNDDVCKYPEVYILRVIQGG